MANALAACSSPYLRQHAHQPVAWVPWSPEAFAEARRRQVPVLVSIGYATCHWCHVMAHESFDDPAVAEAMNARLVCIKVDREEHPEVDAIYMDAVQALTGHGGWPLNAFVDHAGRPFYACTYLPSPRWQALVAQLCGIWRDDPDKIERACADITAHLRDEDAPRTIAALPDDLWQRLDSQLARSFDASNPGYTWSAQRQPKFPPSQVLNLLAQRPGPHPHLAAILEAMQDAGLHDRVGGGFHRYSVDAEWRLPHFEKMLYDNAQLICAYARAGARLGREDFLRTAVNAGDYLLRDLRVVENGVFVGYASAEDADDPEGEGSFYAWSPEALNAVLGQATGEVLAAAWDLHPGEREIGPHGHLDPVISHIPHPRAVDGLSQAMRTSWEEHLPRLREVRAKRPRPIRDDKVLTDQNGLALEAFAVLARLTGAERFRSACGELAAVVLARHSPSGLLRMPGRPAYVTDYGSAATGLLAAFDALGDPRLVAGAAVIVAEAEQRLGASDGGFYATPDGRDDLIRRGRESTDNAWPAGANSLALALVRLWSITGEPRWRTRAEAVIASNAATISQASSACATALSAIDQLERGPRTVVVTGSGATATALLATVHGHWDPLPAIIPAQDCAGTDWPHLDGRRDIVTEQALVCTGDACLPAVTTPDQLRPLLGS